MTLDERIEAAIDRITDGRAPMRIPADPTDADLVLAACREELTSLRARISEMETRHAEQLKTAGQHLLDVQDRLWRVAKAVNSRARSPLDDDALFALISETAEAVKP